MEKEGERFRPCYKCAGFFCFNGPPFPDVFAYLLFSYHGIVFPSLLDNVRRKY